MQYTDYPTLFQASDAASIEQQKCHIRTAKAEFYCVIAASVSSGFFLLDQTSNQACSVVTAIALTGAFASRLLLKIKNWEKNWFDTRAVAESIKTVAWRYAMAISPYQNKLSLKEVDRKFTEEINGILRMMPGVASIITAANAGSESRAITQRMKDIRGLSVKEKMELYVNARVRDQRNWYSTKATINERSANKWFFIILVSEFVGIAFAIWLINNPSKHFNPLGLATTLTAIFCAWAQIKRYQELAQSYALAAQELTSSESLSQDVQTEENLAEYVAETEEAISREHTMWSAKRR